MPRENPDFLAFNRGLVSPLALGRTDVLRTRLSAAVMTNWIPKTQGAMRIRPGTKYAGTSLSNQKAQFLEFVASTTDVALPELTDSVMRVWIPDTGTGLLALLARDTGVDTTVAGVLSSSDTGAWVHTDTGGSATGSAVDQIPDMTAGTTNGVTMSASNVSGSNAAWKAADDDNSTWWETSSAVPQWLQVDFGSNKTITSYSVRAATGGLDKTPRSWLFQGNDVDTGSLASWTFLDSGGDQTGWSASEKRSFTVGSPQAFRFYRWYVTEVNGSGTVPRIAEVELFQAAASGQSHFNSVGLVLNAHSIGGLARVRQEVTVDTGNADVEHGLAITVTRGPVTCRIGSSANDDDLFEEADLGTGRHSLSITPDGNFFITLQSKEIVDRIVGSLALESGGTVSLVAPYTDTGQLDNIRFDQSADVLYLDAFGVAQKKIERRGTGRSWSIVNYEPSNGPFLPLQTSSARLRINQTYGNATLRSDIPFFTADHVGALFRLFHDGQNGTFILGNLGAVTEPVEMTGISDTGTPGSNSERRIVFTGSGTWAGTLRIQRSFDGPDIGFHDTDFSDTGSFTRTIDDPDDNLTVWYRGKISAYTSGALTCAITYKNGGKTGVCRVTSFSNNAEVSAEVIKRFSDTGFSDNWGEGAWSAEQSFPSAPALYEGRLFHAGGAKVNGSVSDDYENFDDETEGDAGPIDRTLGRGPVDRAAYLLPLLRLIIGTVGSEIALRSSSTDEVLTPTNCSAKPISTQGSANLRAVVVDSNGIFVQRSGKRAFAIAASEAAVAFGDYESQELTLLVPDLLEEGVVSVAVQRQPDTRIHFALGDGKVAILTYEKAEEVLCWSLWETDGAVEKVMVLPGEDEDQVYYHIRRTINGSTVRHLEKVAMESECQGGPLNWLADAAVSVDTGGGGLSHLVGESVVAWGIDTGDTGSAYGKDYSPDDTGGDPKLYVVDTGGINVGGTAKTTLVAGLPYTADWTSTKLAYAAAMGTALTQMKRVSAIGFILNTTHNNGLFFGRDTGNLDPLSRMFEGAAVDADRIFDTFDKPSVPFPGGWSSDARIHLRAKAPRPVTVMASVPTIATHDK